MSSYIAKATIGNELDKIIKELTGNESDDDEEKEDITISGEEVLADRKKQAKMKKEMHARQAKAEEKREEERQKIRDKYNIKKNDELSIPAHGKTTTTLIQNKATEVHHASTVENQGFDPVKMTTNVFSSLKQKLGWK